MGTFGEWGGGGRGSIRKPGDLLSEWEGRPDIREKRGDRIHAVPLPPHAQAVGGGSGAQRMRTAPRSGPQADPKARRPDTRSRDRPRKDPAPAWARGEGRAAGPPALGDARGEAASHTWSSTLSGPSPAPSGASRPAVADGRLVPRQNPRRPAAARGLGRGGGGEGEEGNSRSSWQRPCRRSAPPAPPAGLSAPVARGPPSSRAGSGRTRMIRTAWRARRAAATRLEPVCWRDRPTRDVSGSRRRGAEAATRAATAGPGARRLRRLCVRRADNPLRPPTPRDADGPAHQPARGPARPRPAPSASRVSRSPAQLATASRVSPSSPVPLDKPRASLHQLAAP